MIMQLFRAIGLTGSDGAVSFTKMVTLIVLALSYVTGTFGIGIAVTAITASFGSKAWLAFLARGTWGHTQSVAVTINRDDDAGVEPT